MGEVLGLSSQMDDGLKLTDSLCRILGGVSTSGHEPQPASSFLTLTSRYLFDFYTKVGGALNINH